MCNVCGINCGKGGALRTHLKGAHYIEYEDYVKCFYPNKKNVVIDTWDDSKSTKSGKKAMIHILVRRFYGDPGPRGAKTTRK